MDLPWPAIEYSAKAPWGNSLRTGLTKPLTGAFPFRAYCLSLLACAR
jgi:hypothetical protein